MATGIANTPLINYFRYKQSTIVSGTQDSTCYGILTITDNGNGQLLVTTNDTPVLDVGVAIAIADTTSYDGNYTVISKTDTSFVINGIFVAVEAGGTWQLAYNTTGANAGDPLDYGIITFYNASDKVTLQDTYQDRDLTIVNPNPITLDAVGSYPPIYLQNELYYITIYDKFNNLVATLDNYLPYSNGGGTSTSGEVENLFPNYGFDTQINADIYDEQTIPSSTDGHPLSAGWFWRVETTQDPAGNTFSYNVVSANGLLGNPKNELVLKSTNNTGGCTTKEIYAVIGDYNAFQGQQLGLSIYTRLINGAATALTCELVRTRNGTLESPINIGTISISATQAQQILLFDVPLLADANYANDDVLQLVITTPLNTDYEYGFTGTWLQFSPDDTVNIDENASSIDASKEFFGKSFRQLQSPSQWQYRGLPVAIGEGEASVLNQTGSIFLGAALDNDKNYAQSMVAKGNQNSVGYELIAGRVFKQTREERLINYLRDNDLTQSRYTFLVSIPNNDNVMEFSTGIGTAPFSAWSDTLSNGSVTINKTVNEFQYALNANALGNGVTRFTFTEQFAATTNPYNPSFSGNSNLWGNGPVSSPFINWFGNYDFNSTTYSSSSGGYTYVPANRGNSDFTQSLPQNTISGGSTTSNAVVDVYFQDMSNVNITSVAKFFRGVQPGTGTDNVNWSVTLLHKNDMFPLYQSYTSQQRQYVRWNPTTGSTDNYDLNGVGVGYIGYNDATNNPSTQGSSPPRVIGFNIENVATYNGPSGLISTAVVTIEVRNTASEISAKVMRAINTSFVYEVTIVSVPANGDAFTISNYGSQFIVIFYDTNQTKPANPDTNYNPIYVEYTTSQSTAQIATAVQNAVHYAVMGIPKASDLGLIFPDSTVKYFMVL